MATDELPCAVSKIDLAEAMLIAGGAPVRPYGGDLPGLPLTHRFTPGLYTREIFMPAGMAVTTYRHKTEHPFVITQGRVSVYTDDGVVTELVAPHVGITKPGTRRLLYIHEDTVWMTFHPTQLTDVEEIERTLGEHYNPVLGFGVGDLFKLTEENP